MALKRGSVYDFLVVFGCRLGVGWASAGCRVGGGWWSQNVGVQGLRVLGGLVRLPWSFLGSHGGIFRLFLVVVGPF